MKLIISRLYFIYSLYIYGRFDDSFSRKIVLLCFDHATFQLTADMQSFEVW